MKKGILARCSVRRGFALAVAAACALTDVVVGSSMPASAKPTEPNHVQATGDDWIASWGTSMAHGAALGACAIDCTIRNTARMSLGGERVRVKLSNAFGTQDLTVGHTTVSRPRSAGASSAFPGSVSNVTFGGQASVTIPVGQEVTSDPLSFVVSSGEDVHVSVYTPGPVPVFTRHASAHHETFRYAGGDRTTFTTTDEFPGGGFTANDTSNYVVSAVDVENAHSPGSIVLFGDSIIDGSGSTAKGNDRWLDRLSLRYQTQAPDEQWAVVNAGIGGNRVLRDGSNSEYGKAATTRFERDALNHSGVKAVVLFMGINDIQQAPNETNPQSIITGLKQLAVAAHARGIRVVGATILPWKGWSNYSANLDAVRTTVNNWIRTTAVQEGTYDSYVDFDKALRDDSDQLKLMQPYNSGDALHPSALGHHAMALAIDLDALSGITRADGDWVGAWQSSTAHGDSTFGSCTDCTIRNVTRLSRGGTGARIVVSNTMGLKPLTIQRTTVSLPQSPGSAEAVPGSIREVTFTGQATVVVPAGGQAVSDPVNINVTADTDMHVSTYLPGTQKFDRHASSHHWTYRSSGQGDQTSSANAAPFSVGKDESTYVVTRVDVLNANIAGSVVTLGDSITDGSGSSFGTNSRWTDELSRRIGELPVAKQLSVVNAGIGGNQILRSQARDATGGPSSLNRFQRDVLNVPNAKTLVLFQGVNDPQIGGETNPERIKAGLRALVNSAHAAGLRVVGGTITPWKSGASQYTPEREAIRQSVNTWIRNSGVYDAVVDFDRATRDPQDVTRLLSSYNSGDGVHPSDAGFAAMANEFQLSDLGQFESPGLVSLQVADTVPSGGQVSVRAEFTAQTSGVGKMRIRLPAGWTSDKHLTANLGLMSVGQTVTTSWRVQVPLTSLRQASVLVTGAIDELSASGAKNLQIIARPPSGVAPLGGETIISSRVGWGALHQDEDMNADSIDIGGVTFDRGFVANAPAELTFGLNGGSCTSLTTTVGVDPGATGSTQGSVTFDFIVDGKSVRTVGTNAAPIKAVSLGTSVTIDITGASSLVFKAGDAGNGSDSDHAAWGNPILHCGPWPFSPPQVDVSTTPAAPQPSGWFTGPVTASIAGSGGEGTLFTEVLYDGGAWTEFTGPTYITEGSHEVTARVTDRWGSESELKKVLIRRDSVGPSVSARLLGGTRAVEITAADETSGVKDIEYRFAHDGSWSLYTSPIALDNSDQVLEFRAADVAGNIAQVQALSIAGVDPGTDPVIPGGDKRAVPKMTGRVSARALYGHSAPVKITVAGGNIIPTGTVEVRDGGVVLARGVLRKGTVDIKLPQNLRVGLHRLVVAYLGDRAVRPGTQALSISVAKSPVSLKVNGKKMQKSTKSKKALRIKVSIKTKTKTDLNGTVSVVVKRGKKTVATRVLAKRGAAWKKSISFKKLRKGKHTVSITFTGSPTTALARAKLTVRLK